MRQFTESRSVSSAEPPLRLETSTSERISARATPRRPGEESARLLCLAANQPSKRRLTVHLHRPSFRSAERPLLGNGKSALVQRIEALTRHESESIRRLTQEFLPVARRRPVAASLPGPTFRESSRSEAPPRAGQVVIDARGRFQARSRTTAPMSVPIMTAVASEGVDFGPIAGTAAERERTSGARVAAMSLRTPVTLLGQALGLWYWVSTKALEAQLEGPGEGRLVSMFGKSLFGICVGRFELGKQGDPPPGSRRNGRLESATPEDALIELTLLALVRGPRGLEFRQVGRVVDASARHDVLKALAHKRPRELAYLNLQHEDALWQARADGRALGEQLEIRVVERSWLNGLGMGTMMSGVVTAFQTHLPLGGDSAHFRPGGGSKIRLGRLTHIALPERIHLGLLTPESMASPELVTLLPRMVVEVKPEGKSRR